MWLIVLEAERKSQQHVAGSSGDLSSDGIILAEVHVEGRGHMAR
jgi:hypothetical protein